MNAKMIKQIQDDYREILSSNAGKRVLGGIFDICGLTSTHLLGEFQQGRRSVAAMVANTIREINPYGVAECIKAHDDFVKEYPEDERRDDTEPYSYSDDE